MLKMVAKKNNATVILCPTERQLNPVCYRRTSRHIKNMSFIFLPNNDQLQCIDSIRTEHSFIDTLRSSFAVIGVEGQKFFTCYHEQSISFRFYMNPFQRDLWITLACTSFMMAFLLHFYIIKSKMLKFSPYLFTLSTITDDNCAMPGGLAREPVIRMALGPWFLMDVVLVNAYIGLVITGITSSSSSLLRLFPRNLEN
jgi:hypothetical protein